MKFYSLILGLVCYTATAQKQFVTVNYDKVEILRQETTTYLRVPFTIKDGLHVQDIVDTKENLIATEVTFDNSLTFSIVNYSFQAVNYESVFLDDIEHKVISGTFILELEVKLNEKTKSANVLKGQLYYQSCNDRQCFFPRSLPFELSF